MQDKFKTIIKFKLNIFYIFKIFIVKIDIHIKY